MRAPGFHKMDREGAETTWQGERERWLSPLARGAASRCRILIPLDGSSFAEDALAAVQPLASAADIELTLLRVVSPGRPVAAEGRVIMAADEVTGLRRREAAEYLDGLAVALRRRGLRVDTRVAVGDPAEAILAVGAEGVTAIVMATHGRTGLPRILFGSVTAAVVKASRVPVLTVHPPTSGAVQPSAIAESTVAPGSH